MTRNETLQKINAAIEAIDQYRDQGLNESTHSFELLEIRQVRTAALKFIVEAKTIGAAGDVCPSCGGSGRV